MKQYQDEGSVQAWMERARRTQDLVGKIDLEKVARHDAEEVNKLGRVAGALDELSRGGNVEFVPGIDMDEAPELDSEQMRRVALMERLTREGFGERLGQVFFTDGESDGLRPVDLIPHRQGLPEFVLCIAPDFAPIEGAQGVFVSERGVFAATIPDPATRHRWRIVRSRPYDDEAEMIATVRSFISKVSD